MKAPSTGRHEGGSPCNAPVISPVAIRPNASISVECGSTSADALYLWSLLHLTEPDWGAVGGRTLPPPPQSKQSAFACATLPLLNRLCPQNLQPLCAMPSNDKCAQTEASNACPSSASEVL